MSLDHLHALGFDASQRDGTHNRVACSQCAALVINGTPCHERNCPNTRYECNGCNALVSAFVRYCEDCA